MTDEMREHRTAKVLEQRAHDLLLGHSFAQRQIGYIHTLEIDYGAPMKQRTLLEVEMAAQKKRENPVRLIISIALKQASNYIK